jgi:hypothetical protein
MARILANDYVLVDGHGKTYTISQSGPMPKAARRPTCISRTHNRPAKLGATRRATYLRTAKGWPYSFGQASLPMPGKRAR